MNIDDEITRAIFEAHPHDLQIIRRYIAWVRFRRKIHNAFYRPAHWVRSGRRWHWV